MILYAIRAVWIASHILVLIKGDCIRSGYRWWCAYIGLSCMLSVAYWPELLPGWDVAFASFVVGVLLLRTIACLEALHVQTRYFPHWPRMMAGAFLMGFVVVLLLAGVRDSRWAGLLTEYRRYLQIWTVIVMGTVELMLWDRGWGFSWQAWREDLHPFLVFVIALNHGAVSVWAMRAHPEGAGWLNINMLATAIDSAAYLTWAFAFSRAAESNHSPLRPLQSHR